MSYPAASVGFAGQFMLWAGCVASALTWAGARLAGAFEGMGLVAFQPPNDAGSNALWLGVAGIVTIMVNGAVKIVLEGVVPIFKNRYENARAAAVAVAESEARIRAEVADGLRQKDVEISVLHKELDKATDKRHQIRQDFNALKLQAEVERRETQAKVARLEAQLGLTGATHAVAINATAENVEALAEATGTDLPAPAPHVEPLSGSTDELPAFHHPPM